MERMYKKRSERKGKNRQQHQQKIRYHFVLRAVCVCVCVWSVVVVVDDGCTLAITRHATAEYFLVKPK